MNPESSRSHSIFQLFVYVTEPDGHVTAAPSLTLGDLAGCERVEKSGVQGVHFAEAININKSLMNLASCINALTTGAGHIPYRDSVLTTILKNALGGSSKVSLVVNCNPHPDNRDETMSALRFGVRCKLVKNAVVAKTSKSIKQLEAEVEKLTKELALMKSLYSQMDEHHRLVHPDCGWAADESVLLEDGDEDDRPDTPMHRQARALEVEEAEEDIRELETQIEDMTEGEEKERLLAQLQQMRARKAQLEEQHHENMESAALEREMRSSKTIHLGDRALMVTNIAELEHQLKQSNDAHEQTRECAPALTVDRLWQAEILRLQLRGLRRFS